MSFFDYTGTGWLYNKAKKSGAFSSQKVMPEAIQEPDFYPKLRETIGNRWQSILDRGAEKYTGNYVAPLTDLEKKGQQRLGEYGSMNAPALYGEGAAEISKTLANEYDPNTSPYYQAYRDQALYENTEAKRRFTEDAAGAGRFFHGGRIEGTRKIDEATARNLNTTSAALAENERNRRLEVLPQALSYGTAQSELPLRQAGALATYGGAERKEVLNPELAAQYGEFMRQISQGRGDLAGANSFAGAIPYAMPQYSTPLALQYLQAISGAASSAAPYVAMAACHVAEVLYGENDVRTHVVREYVRTHESLFIQAYRKYSKVWAAWLRKHPAMQEIVKPIWDEMFALQMKEVAAN